MDHMRISGTEPASVIHSGMVIHVPNKQSEIVRYEESMRILNNSLSLLNNTTSAVMFSRSNISQRIFIVPKTIDVFSGSS